ncbi:hypothetical protein BGW39_011537 [Mortierella sp. 14UC]|nr:hypothetical protein BGW39_011537 [Mortierella sp. 14UC]
MKTLTPPDQGCTSDSDIAKQILQHRAPGDREPHKDVTHPGNGTGTGTGARRDGATTVTIEEKGEAAKKKAKEDEAAKKKAEEEEAAKKAAKEEEARKKAQEEEAAKKNQEEAEQEAARKATEEAEAARKAKEEAGRKAAVEEAARKAREEAERNKDKDQDRNKETSGDKEDDQDFGNKDNGISDPLDDHMMMGKDDSSEGTNMTIVIGSVAGGAALVAIVVAGFLIRHKRDASRRASAMEAYLSKKVELQPMGGDNNQASPSLSRHNSNNNGGAHVGRGGSNSQGVYSHRSNSRHSRSRQHLTHPSPLHQHANQHYDDQHYDGPSVSLPAMPTLVATGMGSPSGRAEGSDHYYPQYHYEDYHTDQYDQYYQRQGHEYYNHQQQQEYNGYDDQEMYSSGIATEITARSAPTFVDFPLPPSASLAVETASKELLTNADAAGSNPITVISALPRGPYALTCSESTASSSASFSMSSTSAGMKNAKGSSKRSPVEALIASEAGGDVGGSEGLGGQPILRRSGSVLFG